MAKKRKKIDLLAERFGGRWKWNGNYSYKPFTCDDGRYICFMHADMLAHEDSDDSRYYGQPCNLFYVDGRVAANFMYSELAGV